MEGEKNYKSISEGYIQLSRILTWLTCLVFFGILIFGKEFISLWVGDRYISAYIPLVILTLSSSVALSQAGAIPVLQSLNKHKIYAYYTFIEGALNIVLSILLVRTYAIIGVAFGTLIPVILTKVAWQPALMLRILNIDLHTYFYNYLSDLIKLITFSISFMIISQAINIVAQTWIQLVVFVSLFIIAYFTYSFIFIINKTEKKLIINWSKKYVIK